VQFLARALHDSAGPPRRTIQCAYVRMAQCTSLRWLYTSVHTRAELARPCILSCRMCTLMDVCVHICIIRALLCVVVHYLSVGWSILNFTLRFGDLQAEFFKRFQAAHPNIIVQQRAFLKLKPYFVKPLLERNVCCCVYHVEVDLLRQGLNKMRNIRLGIHANNHAFFFL
jgi:hypothetical protein